MRIRLVEDHEELAETIADVLRTEGLAVDVALDGQAALEHTGIYPYDVIVMDRAARALGVSRATVYALLKEVRGEREPARLSP